ncbi:MAG: glycosyltransferase [Candidatus Altiarchaeales archaeon]|nr:glycosyltransferase [Candidatus Altiarchaeales archaeon]
MHYPTVSVIVTTYNRPRSLQRMLACLAEQKHTNFDHLEVIIMDDGSDTTLTGHHDGFPLAVDYLTIDYRYYKRGPGPQLYSLKNKAVEIANNEVLWLLDDDLIFDDHTLILLRTHHALLSDRRPVLIPHLSDNSEPHWFQHPFHIDPSPPEKTHWVSFAGLSLRKEDWLAVEGIDENFDGAMGFADLDLGHRLHKDGCFNVMVDGLTVHIDDEETGSWRHQFLANHKNGMYFLDKWGDEEAGLYGITRD